MVVGGIDRDVAEYLLIAEEIGPEVEGKLRIEGIIIIIIIGEEEDLVLDVEVLMAHVVDLDGDVPPGPEERVGGGGGGS